jgi:hypothetical protein
LDNHENSNILKYRRLCQELLQNCENQCGFDKEVTFFWEKWFGLHLELFQKLKPQEFDRKAPDDDFFKKFIKKRQGLFSAFLQSVAHKKKMQKKFSFLNETLKIHDDHIQHILNQNFKKIEQELIQFQSLRKVSNAYDFTPFSVRG